MINFHPDQNLLIEYSAGTLDWGLAIAVKTHLSLCPECKRAMAQLNLVGSALLESAEVEATDTEDKHAADQASFNQLMAKIRAQDIKQEHVPVKTEAPVKVSAAEQNLPAIVQRLLPKQHKLNWRRVSPSLHQANLTTGQDKYEVCLHKIRRGGKVAEHDHGGREITVVLEGAFSDESGTYRVGDFLVREPGEKHRPTATQDQNCLCLSLVEAPVKLTGLMGKVINPFLSFRPA